LFFVSCFYFLLQVCHTAFPAWPIPALWKAKQPYNVNAARTLVDFLILDQYRKEKKQKMIGAEYYVG
jgi:hypothetical protein